MLLSNAWSTFLLSFTLLCSSVLAQIDPKQLGISYNKEFQSRTGKVVFGSIVEIQGLASWTDEQVAELAFQAADATGTAFENSIDTILDDYEVHHKRRVGEKEVWPGVTTTLVVDNTAYISTSIKGPGAFLYEPAQFVPRGVKKPRWVNLRKNSNPCRTEVVEALARCQLRSTERFKATKGKVDSSGHRTGASCGEPMAALAFCTTGSEKKLAEAGARVMAVRKPLVGKATYAAPCGGWDKEEEDKDYTSEWGCKLLLNSEEGLNIKEISRAAANKRQKLKKKPVVKAQMIQYP